MKEEKPSGKRTKYLRLGYNPNPQTNPKVKKPKPGKETTKPECPGGNEQCRDCKLPVITAEDLTGSAKKPEETGAEMIKSLFEPSLPEEGHVRCCEECGESLCCDGRKEEPQKKIMAINYAAD